MPNPELTSPARPLQPPPLCDQDAEEACLGVALGRPGLMDAVGPLTEHDFTFTRYAAAWRLASLIRESGRAVSALTVGSAIRAGEIAAGESDSGASAVLNDIALIAPMREVDARAAGERLRELTMRRRIAWLHLQAGTDAGDPIPGEAPADLISRALEALTELQADAVPPPENTPADDLDRILARADNAASDTALTIRAGLSDLDRMIGGFRAGELHIIGARPGMGKTIVGANIALNAAIEGDGALYFSLEVVGEQLRSRILCDLALHDGHEIWTRSLRQGSIPRALMPPLIKARYRLEELPLAIEDRRGITLAEMGARARQERARLKRNGKDLSIIVVDYLTLIQPADRYRGNKVAEVTELSRGLKILAGEMGVPVLAMCQLNRNTDNRNNADNRPRLSDLRESGSIEQDADSVTLLFREEYYVQQTRPAMKGTDAYAAWEAKYAEVRDRLEMIVAKNREGETGTIEAKVIARCSAVRDA